MVSGNLLHMYGLVIGADTVCEDEAEQLRASVDFLVELCDKASPVSVLYSSFLQFSFHLGSINGHFFK